MSSHFPRVLRRQDLRRFLLLTGLAAGLALTGLSLDAVTASSTVSAAESTAIDSDGDGLTDAEEVYWGLSPSAVDSDGDGISDYDEFYNRYAYTDPLQADSDNDGISDGEELSYWLTDPTLPDTDFDGVSDRDEIVDGTDPRIP